MPSATSEPASALASPGPDRLSATANASRLPWLAPLLTAVALTVILVTLPRLPLGSDDDSSWSAVLDFAHQKGWQFGTDIAFTYGPLGFLITPYFSPSSPWLRPFTDILITFGAMVGFSWLVWRMNRVWRFLSIVVLTVLCSNADPRSELVLNLGLLFWGLLCVVGEERVLKFSLPVLGALVVFSALAKMTLLLPAALTLAAVAACLLFRDRPKLAAGLLTAVLGSLFLAWLGLGQSLINLPLFVLNGVRISMGYDQTMWADPYPWMKWAGMLMVGLTLSIVWVRFFPAGEKREGHGYRGVMLAWLTGFLFVIWKHGFVRAGRDHLEVFLVFVPVLALAVEALPCSCLSRRRWIRGLALTCCLLSLFSVQWLFAGDVKSCLAKPFRLAALHAGNLLNPMAYQEQMRNLQQAERDANQLPRSRSAIGQSSVDVFGCSQAYALFNNFNFRPRPVFQSYAAYSAPLMNLNQQFYSSPKAPEFVLFNLNPIDERFPPLEDALVFRHLLMNYQPVDAEGPFLLLKSRSSVTPTLTLVREGTLGQGDVIGLKEYGNANLWLEIDVRPNVLGYIGRLLYRPPEVTLAAWVDTPSVRVARFRAPAPMLAAGFLASPLPLDNGDIVDLYTGKPITRPSAYSIEFSPGAPYLWSDSIHFRLYRIENQLGQSASKDLVRLIDFPGFGAAPQEIVAPRHAMITVQGKPALYLPPGGSMRFAAPDTAKKVEGVYGFAPAAYVLGGATEGAEFRVEEERPGGKPQVLYSQTLRPVTHSDDRGMKAFSIPLPAGSARRIVFRATALGQATPRDLTCWGEIRFQ